MDAGRWLTGVRVEQLGRLLVALKGFPRGQVREDRAIAGLFPAVGGQVDDLSKLVDVAVQSEVVRVRSGHIVLTREGRQVVAQDATSGGRLLAKALIGTGLLGDQARSLVSHGHPDGSGGLACPRREALEHAPQLTSLLRRWPDVSFDSHLRIPSRLVVEITGLGALLPPEVVATGPEDVRTAVGDRAELYSYFTEIERAIDDSRIDWVARSDSSLGFDIEDRSADPSRMIEVKGSRGTDVRFLLSPNEFRLAHREPDRYEIQFWGGINLDRKREVEYAALRALDYPIVFKGLRAAIGSGVLTASPEAWLVKGDPSALST